MSYNGIRKLKTFQDTDNTWNFSCEVYDSSIRSWDGKRIWEKVDKWFKQGLNTKEELERYLFENTLDGNIHGTGGKYSCIAWGNCKVSITDEAKNKIEELEKEYWDLYDTLHNKLYKEIKAENENYTWEDIIKVPKYKEMSDKLSSIGKEKREFRYNSYFKAWKEYLAKQNENRKTGKVYIVKLDWKWYKGIYIQSIGSARTKFTYYTSEAKLFTKSIEELKEIFCNNPNYTNIEFLEISKYITGKGKYRKVNISNTELQELISTK